MADYNPIKEIQDANKKVSELNADGSPSWIGGRNNPNYQPRGVSMASGNNWTSAERARLKALEAQKKGTLQALNTASQNVRSQFEQGKSTLSGQYQAGRRSLAEYLSQRGLTSSGIAAQGQIQGLSALGQGLSQLEATREQALANIEAQRAEAERAYLEGKANLAGQAEERAFERDLSAIQAGAYQQDIQAEINRRMAINPNDPSIPFLQAQRNQKLAGIASAEAEQRQQDFENRLALSRLRSSGSGGGMTDEEYMQWAAGKATSSGVFDEDTFNQLMALRNPTQTTTTDTTPTPSATTVPNVSEKAQVMNATLQYEGKRISLAEYQRQLARFGYRYDVNTDSVVPI